MVKRYGNETDNNVLLSSTLNGNTDRLNFKMKDCMLTNKINLQTTTSDTCKFQISKKKLLTKLIQNSDNTMYERYIFRRIDRPVMSIYKFSNEELEITD